MNQVVECYYCGRVPVRDLCKHLKEQVAKSFAPTKPVPLEIEHTEPQVEDIRGEGYSWVGEGQMYVSEPQKVKVHLSNVNSDDDYGDVKRYLTELVDSYKLKGWIVDTEKLDDGCFWLVTV